MPDETRFVSFAAMRYGGEIRSVSFDHEAVVRNGPDHLIERSLAVRDVPSKGNHAAKIQSAPQDVDPAGETVELKAKRTILLLVDYPQQIIIRVAVMDHRRQIE